MKRLQFFTFPLRIAARTFATLSLALLISEAASAVSERVVITGLDKPWAVVPSPEGTIWISEKPGAIKIYSAGYALQAKLTTFPDFVPYGEGGILDIAFHPQYSKNSWVYVAYSVADNAGGYYTRVNRFTYRGGVLQDHKVIFNGPASNTGTHFGCRLVFDDSGYLYASFGERREMYKAQDMSVSHGKIIRVADDGSIPRTNPFGAQSAIYSLGHRNPQGLAIHPVSRKLYDSEHGPTVYDAPEGGDEINEIVAGGNYGWPKYHHRLVAPGFREPIAEYTPAVAPSGIAFYTGHAIPQWKNDLFVATLRGKALRRLTIDAQGRVTGDVTLLDGKHGRLRDVATAPDGSLLVLSEGGKLIQLK